MEGATRVISDPEGRLYRQVKGYQLARSGEAPRLVSSARFSIGTHQGNDWVLAEDGISRFHCEIRATPAGFVLRDLGSTNGTWINGLRVLEGFLPAKCTLRLGQTDLAFELTGEETAVEATLQPHFHGVIGVSARMREVFALLERVAPTDATVLLEGESGCGKEQVARAIVAASGRSGAPLVTFDCAAVPRSLIESELFGHEAGAFTGATSARAGRFEEADGGTLFLDELGELPLDLQPKLLRVLESREIRRLGSSRTRKVDVRLVAATNRNLAQEVNAGSFRADLYYRVAVVRLELPALRERAEDIRPLSEYFIKQLSSDESTAGRILAGISSENWRRLSTRPWRGNVRELRNFIERTLILSESGEDLAVESLAPGVARASANQPGIVDLDRAFRDVKAEVVTAFERAYLLGQLARHENNVSAAARASGLDRMNYKRLLRKYNA